MAERATSYSDFFKRRSKDSRRGIPEKGGIKSGPRRSYPEALEDDENEMPSDRTTQPYTGGSSRGKPAWGRRKTPNPGSMGANGAVAAARKEALKARLKYKKS
jgi:hypothetical protein